MFRCVLLGLDRVVSSCPSLSTCPLEVWTPWDTYLTPIIRLRADHTGSGQAPSEKRVLLSGSGWDRAP